MTEIPTRRGARNRKLAAIPLGMAGRAAVNAGRRLIRTDTVDVELNRKAAEQVFAVLGELKGGAMKFGQALSVFEAAVPQELAAPYREALTKLQAAAPPLPAVTVHRVLDEQLGTRWRDRFASFDDEPAAAASIGQVHRAVWSDGRSVAVKVQYPGAEQAVRADLKTLSRFAGLLAKLVQAGDVKHIIDELRDRTEQELDYRTEAANQRAFALVFDGHARFRVPRVVASAPKVIVSEWLSGTPLSHTISNGTQTERDAAAELLAEFQLSSPALVGLMHCDPHPGNFLTLPDGRLGIVDFGACVDLPVGLPEALGTMVRHASDADLAGLATIMRHNGFVVRRSKISDREIADYLRPVTDPLEAESFRFTRAWLQQAMLSTSGLDSRATFRAARAMDLPAEYVMIMRVLLGTIGICAQLEATAPFMRIVSDWMPGYDGAPGRRDHESLRG